MIIEKLLLAELSAQQQIKREKDKLKAVRSLIDLLSQIDFTAEVVPIKGSKKLNDLLVSLKGKPLSNWETDLVSEIVNT